MASRKPTETKADDVVTAYIDATDEPARGRLNALRKIIRKEAPDAIERIAYGLATWHQGENLIHLGAFKQHIGVYPGPAAILAFADDLTKYKTSKGAIQLPHAQPLPTDLMRRIVRHRVEQVSARPKTAKKSKPSAKKASEKRPAAEHYPRVEVSSRAELRAWFQAEHASSRGAWIVAWKKHTGKRHVDPTAISEEALCVGWIDSLPRALDEDRSMLLVTPRKPKSAWSRVNKERVARLTDAGLMTPAGLASVRAAQASGTWQALDKVEDLTLPEDLNSRFKRAPAIAREHFDGFPRSVKRGILEWIQTAKKPETRARRIEETVMQAAENVRANQWRP